MGAKFQDLLNNSNSDFNEVKRLRFALQENMNNTIENFKTVAEVKSAQDSDSISSNGVNEETQVVYDLILKSKELAIVIASKVFNKPFNKVDKFDAKPFRAISSEIVSQYWKKGNLEDLNLDNISDIIAKSADAVDPDFEFNSYNFINLTPEESVKMTSANVTASLLLPIMDYSFRQHPQSVLERLTSAILQKSHENVQEMLGENHSDYGATTLLQSFSKHNTTLMAKCYSKRAAFVAHSLVGKTPDEIQEYYKNNDPVSDILSDFNKWSVLFASSTYTFAKAFVEANTSVQPSPKEPTRSFSRR